MCYSLDFYSPLFGLTENLRNSHCRSNLNLSAKDIKRAFIVTGGFYNYQD